VLRKVQVFQKYSPGRKSVSSGGFSLTSSAEATHPGLETTCPGVSVGMISGAAVAGTTGAGVSVGRAETSVREFCACTVKATAVAISESFCAAGVPHDVEINAMHINSGNVLYL
jgi:hypothetical protein